eukprot:4672360-Heterocapsa_arctica.AAC.1
MHRANLEAYPLFPCKAEGVAVITNYFNTGVPQRSLGCPIDDSRHQSDVAPITSRHHFDIALIVTSALQHPHYTTRARSRCMEGCE